MGNIQLYCYTDIIIMIDGQQSNTQVHLARIDQGMCSGPKLEVYALTGKIPRKKKEKLYLGAVQSFEVWSWSVFRHIPCGHAEAVCLVLLPALDESSNSSSHDNTSVNQLGVSCRGFYFHPSHTRKKVNWSASGDKLHFQHIRVN